MFIWIHTGTTTLVITGDVVLRAKVLEMFHDSPVGGHLGLHHVFHQLSYRDYWWGMYHDCQTCIHNCLIC